MDPTIVGAIIAGGFTVLATGMGLLARQNSKQHADGRDLIRSMHGDVLDVKGDVREVKADVRGLRGRVTKLEGGTEDPI